MSKDQASLVHDAQNAPALGFLRAAGLRTALTAVSRGSSLVAFALVVRRSSVRGAGDLFFMLAGGLLLATLVGLGLESAVSRLVATAIGSHHDERADGVLSDAVRLNVIVSSAAIVGTTCLWLAAGKNHQLALLIGSGWIAGSTSAGLICASYMRARGRSTRAELLPSITSIAFLALLIIHGLVWPGSDPAAVPLRLAAEIPCVLVVLTMGVRATVRAGTGRGLSHVFGITLPLWLTLVTWVVLQQSDVFLLGLYRGGAEVSGYAPVLKIADIASLPFGLIGAYVLPEAVRRFARSDHRSVEDLYVRSTQLAWIATAPVLTTLAVAPRALVTALFGHVASTHLVIVSRFLVLAYFVNGLCGFNGIVLQAIGSRRSLVQCAAIGLSVGLGVNVVAIAWLGDIGAAVGTAAGFCAFLGAHSVVLARDHGISPLHARLVVPLAVSAVFAGLLTRMSLGDGVGTIGFVAVSSLVVAAATSALTSWAHVARQVHPA